MTYSYTDKEIVREPGNPVTKQSLTKNNLFIPGIPTPFPPHSRAWVGISIFHPRASAGE